MTWTLRLYDETDVEIGYVEKPDKETYNVYITHPDSGWDEFESYMGSFERVNFDEEIGHPFKDLGWPDEFGPMDVKEEPETHLQKVQTEIEFPAVARTELNDE